MKFLNAFNLFVMSVAALLTWGSLAEAKPLKVHVLQNLSPSESSKVDHALKKLGFIPSNRPLFSESHEAIIVTKVIATEREPASVKVELVHQEREEDLPRTVAEYQWNGDDLSGLLSIIPGPEAFKRRESSPFAAQ